ncbi:MAG TPA: hypothetical protein PLT86_14020, partial [Candidatus Latescibacteria bacterium]|nr:hypothetical protein [Candidatus Latescibacterota bacterium]
MKITAIDHFVCQAGGRNWVFVKVSTDEGVYGVGEGSLYGKEHTMRSAIEELRRDI